MNKRFNFKLYVNAGNTLLNVENIKTLTPDLPTREQIVTHINSQVKGEQFRLIELTLTKDKYDKVLMEIGRLSSRRGLSSEVLKEFFICIVDSKHPIILVKFVEPVKENQNENL